MSKENDYSSKQTVGPEILRQIQSLPVVDRTSEFQKLGETQQVSEEEKQAFLRHKALILKRSSHLAEDDKNKALVRIASGRKIDLAFDQGPPPGGVGFGVFYKPGQLSFINNTQIRKLIVFPDQAGGDINNFIYLTSTNRSAKGVEAYISRFAQGNAEFKVFDWAKSGDARFTLTISGSLFDHYKLPYSSGGIQSNGMVVLNSTTRLSGNNWENTVQLMSLHPTMHAELVYSYQYTLSSDNEQHDPFNGSWGPIVETFQTYHQDFNPMGFDGIFLVQDGTEHDLDQTNTDLRDDNVGITVISQSPDRSFLVK